MSKERKLSQYYDNYDSRKISTYLEDYETKFGQIYEVIRHLSHISRTFTLGFDYDMNCVDKLYTRYLPNRTDYQRMLSHEINRKVNDRHSMTLHYKSISILKRLSLSFGPFSFMNMRKLKRR